MMHVSYINEKNLIGWRAERFSQTNTSPSKKKQFYSLNQFKIVADSVVYDWII